MHNICENMKIVTGLAPTAGGADATSDYVSMSKMGHLTVVATIAQGSATAVSLTLKEAKDVSGTDAQSLAKDPLLWSNEDTVSGDALTKQTPSETFTTSTAVKNKIVVWEIDAADLSDGFDAVALLVEDSAATNITSVLFVGSDLRYGVGQSAIVD